MLQTIQIEPFPLLTWNEYCWSGQTTLTAWQGFQTRLGAYDSLSSTEPSTGLSALNVATAKGAIVPPTIEQSAAYEYLVANQDAIRDAIIQFIFAGYAELQESYGYDEDEAKEYMPDLTEPTQLKTLIGLSFIHILFSTLNGAAYVGFEFGCTWDGEHGLGVMTHNGRMVDIGGADTSFMNWIADQDAEQFGSATV